MPLRDYPKYFALQEIAEGVPDADQTAIESTMALLRVSGDIISLLDGHFAQHQLSQGRFFVLMFLEQSGKKGLSATQLAEKAVVTRATMTGLIDSLERDSLVRRYPHPTDRRTNIIRITDKGKKVIRQMVPGHFAKVADAMKPLTEDERKVLLGLLRKVRYGVDEGKNNPSD